MSETDPACLLLQFTPRPEAGCVLSNEPINKAGPGKISKEALWGRGKRKEEEQEEARWQGPGDVMQLWTPNSAERASQPTCPPPAHPPPNSPGRLPSSRALGRRVPLSASVHSEGGKPGVWKGGGESEEGERPAHLRTLSVQDGLPGPTDHRHGPAGRTLGAAGGPRQRPRPGPPHTGVPPSPALPPGPASRPASPSCSPLSADACSVAPEVPSMTLMAPRAVTARMALSAGW